MSSAQEQTNDAALPALIVDSAVKRFSVPADRVQTLKERALHPLRSRVRNEFEVLGDVSFHIEKGEFFGLVGRNGSGKSTLLKCIAGIYGLDGGAILHDGAITSFIELGVGFNPELAAFDNVVLNATLLGLDPADARGRFEQVMDFAELWEFENLKLKNYSSGMYVRLAFSVMLQVDADILLIDEVLAVGDAAFQQKCFDEFNRMREERKTIIFVTHDMSAVKRFCDRALLLDRGKVRAIGTPADVSERYLELNFSSAGEAPAASEHRGAHVVDVWVEDETGARRGAVAFGKRMSLHALVEFEEDAREPWLSVAIRNERKTTLLLAHSSELPGPLGPFRAGERAHVVVGCDCLFASGRCTVAIEAGPVDEAPRRYFQTEPAGSFVVTGGDLAGADMMIPRAFEVSGEPAAAPRGETGVAR